ncbi:MAG: PAS domain S-box protein, partial [Ignavibacteria bacterium]|nr:PAS domain S-box protein [Ignavibacteria bacterium]
ETLHLPVIFLTSCTDDDTFQRAKLTDPFGYLIKPFDIKDLKRSVEMALFRNKTNNKLLENQRLYEIAVEAGKTGVWEYWINEKKYFSDKNLKALYGFTDYELSDNLDDWSKLVHEDDREEMSDKFENFLKNSEKEFRLEHRINKKDGSFGWVIDRGVLFQPDGEKPLRLIGTTTDITDKKKSELALIKSEERFRNIFENSATGMAILEPNGLLSKTNRVFREMIGYDEDELTKMNFRDITHPGDLEKSVQVQGALLSKEKADGKLVEKRYLNKNGEIIWALTSVSLLRDFEGKPHYFIAQVQNITARKKSEQQLVKYAEELNTLNASKDKFFSIISHDLRSPFNALLGITEYISQSYNELSPAEIRDSIANIYTSSQKLYNLISNLLEWSRLQTGRFDTDKTSIELVQLIDEVKNLYISIAITKGIKIDTDVSRDVVVFADRYMIESILRNLISNAIKFTDTGGKVKIEVSTMSKFAQVSVSDNGVGISKENISSLFKIDEQYRTDGTANEKGTGLGLILCKEFIENNNGTISVESVEGKGSSFIITIPLHRV